MTWTMPAPRPSVSCWAGHRARSPRTFMSQELMAGAVREDPPAAPTRDRGGERCRPRRRLRARARMRHPLRGAVGHFGAVFIKRGVSACDMGTSYHLPRLVGASRSAELLLTGRVFDAEEAQRIGLVLDVVDDGEVVERALVTAREIAANGPLAVWMTKETMWQTVDAPSLRHALDLENRTQIMCTATGELARPRSRRSVTDANPSGDHCDQSNEYGAPNTAELFDLTGKVVIVTGSTKGIGRAMVEGLASAGAVGGGEQPQAGPLRSRSRRRSPRRPAPKSSPGPAMSASGMRSPRSSTRCTSAFGRIDGLVNNAGINPARVKPEDMTLEYLAQGVRGEPRRTAAHEPVRVPDHARAGSGQHRAHRHDGRVLRRRRRSAPTARRKPRSSTSRRAWRRSGRSTGSA